MKVKLVTTWQTACGIAEHSYYLVEAIRAVDSAIVHEIVTDLHPRAVLDSPDPFDLLVLNYQAALHSQWQPEAIRQVRAKLGVPTLCIYHDTGVPNSDLCKAIIDVADAAVVHESFDDLPAEKTHYWRMGVPGWAGVWQHDPSWRASSEQPILGTIGFPFHWKNYDQLARVTAEAGWALLLLAPGATDEQVASWRVHNPHIWVARDFAHRRLAVSYLAGCDATAFTYVCHNTGQSGAILQGIAARKPVIALSTCRQFRALYEDPLGRGTINWCETFEDVAFELTHAHIERVDAAIVALAEQDSWAKLGAKYAALYRSLV